MGNLIAYREERTLEDAAYTQGCTPTRLFHLLFPVWCVEVEASLVEGEDYELIDRYLSRGILEGGLRTTADLARFFSLEEPLVDRALRFLSRIGHVTTEPDGRLALTEIGRRSVRDRRRYVLTRKDRRKLYFDAFESRPLTRPYYDRSTVTLLTGQELVEVLQRREWPRFQRLQTLRGFREQALAELAALRDRDHFNLPERIDTPRLTGTPECVFLPLYVVRAARRDGRIRYLAYTQVAETADADITHICERTPEVVGVLENEEARAGGERVENGARNWLRKRGFGDVRPVRRPDGMVRVTLPGSAFSGEGPSLSRIGSFVVQGNDFFQLWCADERVRRRALLERADSYFGSRPRIDRADAGRWIARLGRRLALGDIDVPELRRMALRAGRRDLAAQLERL